MTRISANHGDGGTVGDRARLARRVRRGRWYFLILATPIFIDKIASIALACAHYGENTSLWRSVLVPAIFLYCLVSLWQGDNWLRWMMAVWLMIHGGVSLFIVAMVMYKLADVTTPGQPDLLRDILSVFFGTLSLHAGFYICAGLAMLISPSLKSFFRHQSQTAGNPFAALTDWIRGLVQRDRPAQPADDFLRTYRNRRRYPVLTRAMLESLDDLDLAAAVVDHVQLRIDADGGSDLAVVSALPRGFQAVYSTWWARVEFDNGGLYQYFYNHGVNWAFMALEGYKTLGAAELASVMARAIEVYLREESEQAQYRTDDPQHLIERYVESQAASSLPELDRAFGAAPQEQAAAYIRCHLNEFVTA